jgi:aerotaxis receptor
MGLHMTFQNSKTTFHTRNNDNLVAVDDMILTWTDREGILQECSQGFHRVSGFTAVDIVEAPQNILRNSDMPKCVVSALWSELEKGIPSGAYMVSCTKAGDPYWVYMVILPTETGFMVAQFKPASDVLEAVRNLYRELNDAERAGVSFDGCAGKLQQAFAEMGFSSYSAFYAGATMREMSARKTPQSISFEKRASSLESALKALSLLTLEQADLMKSFDAIQGIPSNMRIVASRLEPAGGPVSAISQNYRLMSDEVPVQLKYFFVEGTKDFLSTLLLQRLESIVQKASMSILLAEDIEASKKVEAVDPSMAVESMLRCCMDECKDGLAEIVSDAEKVARMSKEVRQLVTGLDSIRVLCRVEAGRLGKDSVALIPVIDSLDKFHKKIDSRLEGIISLLETVRDTAATSRGYF